MKYCCDSFEKFKMDTDNKKLVAFGGGAFLDTINDNYEDLELEKRISYIVDNDSKKVGLSYTLGNKEKRICSINELLQEKKEDLVILISSRWYAYDIYVQLDKIDSLKNVIVYILPLMIMNRVDDITNLDNLSAKNEDSIPKCIHCFWFSDEKKDELSKRCLDSWKKICPEYTIYEWNSSSYDVSKNKFMKKAYEMKKWAFVSDYARLDILNQYGGIYLDLDVELIKKPDKLLYNDFFIGFGPIRDIEGAAFGAVKNSFVLEKMLNLYDTLEFDNSPSSWVVQPVYWNNVFRSLNFTINGCVQEKDGISLLARDVFSCKNWFTGKYNINKETIGIHHFNGAWQPNKKKYNRFSSYKNIDILMSLLNI